MKFDIALSRRGFDQLSDQLMQASHKGIMRAGSGQPVVFDEAAARAGLLDADHHAR